MPVIKNWINVLTLFEFSGIKTNQLKIDSDLILRKIYTRYKRLLFMLTELLANPVSYILVVNIITLIWAVRSWKKTIREKWMNNLRDCASELIGATEDIYLRKINLNHQSDKMTQYKSDAIDAMSAFIAKEKKLLLLFKQDNEDFTQFKELSEQLRSAAGTNNDYRNTMHKFRELVGSRLSNEWRSINTFF